MSYYANAGYTGSRTLFSYFYLYVAAVLGGVRPIPSVGSMRQVLIFVTIVAKRAGKQKNPPLWRTILFARRIDKNLEQKIYKVW